MTDQHTFKWGIIGCGLIAPRFFQALEKTGEGRVVAAASKSHRRAAHFQRRTGVERIYTSYEAMLEKEPLDAVYVATTHNFHSANARLCLERNIPVLVEKAFTQNAQQASGIIELARSGKLFLMEAMWTRFNPASRKLVELLARNPLGAIQSLEADFCVRMNPLSPKMRPWNRMYSPRLAGGALLDIGVYPIAFARMILGQSPEEISSEARMTWTGVDKTSAYTFRYPGGITGSFKSSFVQMGAREFIIRGSEGEIRIPNFYRADRFVMKRTGDKEEIHICGEPGFEFQIQEVHRCLRAGRIESLLMPLDESLETMQTMDHIRAQWGLKYPGE